MGISVGALAVLLVLSACSRPVPPPETHSELHVAVRNGPTTYYLTPDETGAGFEHDLLATFARQQGWSLTLVEKTRPDEITQLVHSRRAHLAAAALPRRVVRDQHLIAGPTLLDTPVQVVYRMGTDTPRRIQDLVGKKIALVAGSGHTPLLQRLKRKHSGLAWVILDNVWPEELLVRLREAEFDAVIINGVEFDPLRNAYPNLAVGFDLGDKQSIVWALPKNSPLSLRNALTRFIETARRDGTLRRIQERYFGHVKRLEVSDMRGILQRRPVRLPALRRHFHQAQMLTGIDWRLLAAIGYQESQWDSNAISPTGVRGLMMLTAETADRMNVNNRIDTYQSILGGARYFALLKDSLPARIAEPDRSWLALAAYNQGLGHLEDARRIAQARGGNPDSWADVKQALPYLSRGGYPHVMKYGYARGHEALEYTESIRNYYDMLQRLEPGYPPTLSLGERIAALSRN